MVGLTGTQVIPAGWEERHRPVDESTMTALGRLVSPGPAGEFPDYTPASDQLLAQHVPLRVQRLRETGRTDAQGDLTDTRTYLVTMPIRYWPTGTRITDTGPIVIADGYKPGHDGDPDLLGRRLRVTNVQHGSLMWERPLECVLDLSEAPQ